MPSECNCLASCLILITAVGIVYYHHLNSESKRKLQSLQNSCLRFSFDIIYRNHITSHYRRLILLKLEAKYTLNCAVLIYKVIKWKESEYLYNLLCFRSDCPIPYLPHLSIPKHIIEKIPAAKIYNTSIVQPSFLFKKD